MYMRHICCQIVRKSQESDGFGREAHCRLCWRYTFFVRLTVLLLVLYGTDVPVVRDFRPLWGSTASLLWDHVSTLLLSPRGVWHICGRWIARCPTWCPGFHVLRLRCHVQNFQEECSRNTVTWDLSVPTGQEVTNATPFVRNARAMQFYLSVFR